MNQIAPAETSQDNQAQAAGLAYAIAARTAAVAGVFSLIVCALLLYDYRFRKTADPLEEVPFQDLRSVLAQQPDNEKLREDVRKIDLQWRQAYFRQRAFTAWGAWLLLGGVAVFLIAAKTAATLRRKLPAPEPQTTPQDVELQWTRIGRWSVVVLIVVLAGVAAGLSLAQRSELPQSEKELASMLSSLSTQQPPRMVPTSPKPPRNEKQPLAPSNPTPSDEQPGPTPYPIPPPSDDEIRKMWPRFRGPGGLGISAYTNVPESWDDKSGKNIVWKTAVPLPGNNSPVVWGDRVFLSGATEERREVYCFAAETGKPLWKSNVPDTPQSTGKVPKVNHDTGYAAPTTVTDGRWVFAIFANGDVAAFDFEGKSAWSRGLGIPENAYGHAASLAMYKNLLLVQFDQAGKKDGKSKLLALDVTKKGETAWEVPRQVPNSWPSPIVIHHAGRDQLITCADPWVIAYDLPDGAEIWRAKVLRQDVGPSPIFANGVVYVVNEWPQLSALRPDGKGDVTETHVLWIGEDGLPDTCSPLATEQYVFLLTSNGTLTCYDAKTGEMLWEEYEAFDNVSFTSSPSLVGNRLYLFGEIEKEGEEDAEGNPLFACKAWVIEPSREGCKIISESYLDEGCVTSPAFQDGRIYIRGEKHLFCLGEK